jgi:hypothetical protein
MDIAGLARRIAGCERALWRLQGAKFGIILGHVTSEKPV